MSVTALIVIILGEIMIGMIFAFCKIAETMETIVVDRFGENFQIEDVEPYLVEIGFSALSIFLSELNRILMAISIVNVLIIAATKLL